MGIKHNQVTRGDAALMRIYETGLATGKSGCKLLPRIFRIQMGVARNPVYA